MKRIFLGGSLALALFGLGVAQASLSPKTITLTFTVNSVADSVDAAPGNGTCADASGQCSLRAAIMEANAVAGPDYIVFDPITDGQPILLQLHGTGEDSAATGDLDITEGLTITGNGSDKTIVDGDAADRVFDLVPSSGTITVEIDSLTVQHGDGVADGGGIRAQHATLVMHDDVIKNNKAQGPGTTAQGGGIYGNSVQLTLDASTVSANAASASLTATGGGIDIDGASALSVLNGCVIEGNVANAGPSSFASGGGIHTNTATLTVDVSVIRANEATDINSGGSAYGGGIAANSTAYTVTDSEISGNAATAGPQFAFGGGMDIEYASADSEIVDSTITGNSATADPSSGAAYGGGVSVDSTPSGIKETLANDTIAGNNVAASGSGGGGVDVYMNTGQVVVQNSIVAANQDGGASAPDCVGSFGGSLTSGGYNLIGDSTGCNFGNSSGDQIGTGSAPIDPLLGALANNGGTTLTMGLLIKSPAVDAGNPGGCKSGSGQSLTADQRGDPRPTDGDADGTAVCDIGAYERAADNAPAVSDGAVTTDADTAVDGVLAGSDADGDALTFVVVSTPQHGKVQVTDAATGAFTYTPAAGYSGSDSFTFSANDGYVDSTSATESITVKSVSSGGSGGSGGSQGGSSGSGGGGAFSLLAVLGLIYTWRAQKRAPGG